jgi:hypothetical protein
MSVNNEGIYPEMHCGVNEGKEFRIWNLEFGFGSGPKF